MNGESLGEGQSECAKASVNASIDKWMIKEEEKDAKGKQKLGIDGDVLVVVGWANSAPSLPRICLMKTFQYILYWQGTHSQRYVRLWHTSPSFY